MGQNQEEFKNTLESLGKSIQQFYNYNKKEHHAEISDKVKVINEALANVTAEARKYNSREHLFERQITDYSKIQEMAKDFLPYSHLWLTTTNWIHNREAWMYGEWFSIDAEECEKFVEDSIKNLNFSIRFFKDKGIQHIQKIA